MKGLVGYKMVIHGMFTRGTHSHIPKNYLPKWSRPPENITFGSEVCGEHRTPAREMLWDSAGLGCLPCPKIPDAAFLSLAYIYIYIWLPFLRLGVLFIFQTQSIWWLAADHENGRTTSSADPPSLGQDSAIRAMKGSICRCLPFPPCKRRLSYLK